MTYYDATAQSYDALYGEEQLRKFEKIKNELTGRVLDVGCGTGIVTKYIKNVVGLDNSKEMLKFYDGEKVFGDAHELPFQDKSFDTVLSLTVLQDLEKPLKALKEMKRVGKKVVFSIQKRNWDESRTEKLINAAGLQGKMVEGEKDWFFIQK
jgi:demethylmenaquinone methyltransferase/2-methoxy-6-polyprenyl-1,4-benzoquinol methylase